MKEENGDEAERLKALNAYNILDTLPEREFDDLTFLAAQICQTPIALISLIDDSRQWFKSKVGLAVSETPKSIAFCIHTIERDVPLIVEDALKDERFTENPLVTGEPHIRFYAGVPLIVPSGCRVGTLCVIDSAPRQLTDDQLHTLQVLSRQVVSQLELRRTNLALKERENRLQAILQANNECIHLLDKQGMVLEINLAGLALLETENEADIIGRSLYALISPEHRNDFEVFNQQSCQGRPGTLAFDLMTCHGNRRSVKASAIPLTVADGRTHSLVIMRDITEHQSIMQSLQDSESTLRSFFDSSPMMMGVVELLEDDILHISDNAMTASLFGVTPAMMHNRRDSEMGVPIDNIRQWIRHYRTAEQTQKPQNFEYTHDTEAGLQWLSATVAALEHGANQPARFAYVVENISKRKQVEMDLLRQSLTFQKITDGVILTDPEGYITDWNLAAEMMFGYTKAEVLGQTPGILYSPKKSSILTQQIIEGITREGQWSGEITFIRKDGSTGMCETVVVPLLDPEGQVVATIRVNHDITQRHQAEQHLQKLNLELTRSNEELEQFAYVASHDLKEPLRMVVNFSQILAEEYQGQLDDEGNQCITFIIDGAKRMLALVQDLLTYSRVGIKDSAKVATDLNVIMSQVIANLRTSIEESQANITIETLPTVLVNSTELLQLLQNLVGNALKYCGKVTPQIHVTATDTDSYWTIAVSDNGLGIDPKYKERIFDIFQRLHTREEYSGTGIGLAICKKIVEFHGGHIWLESNVGQGSTFFFSMPKSELDEPPPPIGINPRHPSDTIS